MSSPSQDFSVTFRGVRGSSPSPGPLTTRHGGNTSCVEVRAGDEILILDAGTGIRALGLDLIAEFGDRPIAATVLISHTHWDHIQGLPFFSPAFSAKNEVRVVAARGWGSTVARALRQQMDPISFPIPLEQLRGLREVEELASDGAVHGAFHIAVTKLNHPGGCAGFRIEAHGGSFAYLPDHERFENPADTDALAEFVREVDLLVLDTQYTEEEFQRRRGWGHGCVPDSVALALNAGVRQLAFFHHDPAHDDNQIDAMIKGGRALAREEALIVRAAKENETIVLGSAAEQTAEPPLQNFAKRVAAL
jgi:phosphoribosyl 1,2-cyclic phosphodiesterase